MRAGVPRKVLPGRASRRISNGVDGPRKRAKDSGTRPEMVTMSSLWIVARGGTPGTAAGFATKEPGSSGRPDMVPLNGAAMAMSVFGSAAVVRTMMVSPAATRSPMSFSTVLMVPAAGEWMAVE